MTTETAVGVEAVVKLSLGYVPETTEGCRPSVLFADRLGETLDSTAARPVDSGKSREVAREQLLGALEWCACRFPLSMRAGSNPCLGSIHEINLGRSVRPGRLLSSSSPDLAGVVFLAAQWPLLFEHRVASIIAHESIHQALYLRETCDFPVRGRSLGYSPWKDTGRPGRWVWHAYWTFSCQVALLMKAVVEDPSLQDIDVNLVKFVADMDAKVGLCLYSLSLFDIVSETELARCQEARSVLDGMATTLAEVSRFDQERVAAVDRAHSRLASWAATLVTG